MNEALLGFLRSPRLGLAPLAVSGTSALRRTRSAAGDTTLTDAVLVGPDGADPSRIADGIWQALGTIAPPRTLARLSNVLAPWPQIYESLWRPRSTPLLTNRQLSVDDELAEMNAAISDVDGAFVVDVGCAEGLMARTLAARRANVLAVDYSMPLLKRARMRAARAPVSISLCQAVAQSLPILDGTTDAVVMGGSLNEIGDMDAAIGEVARILKPGGTFFCVSLLPAPTGRGRTAQRLVKASGIAFPSETATLELFADAGLTVVRQRITGCMSRITATK
jgi:ubiquinone/menaquinone biosynthesis C-methylase UbiE